MAAWTSNWRTYATLANSAGVPLERGVASWPEGKPPPRSSRR
jgi:hypothetical protein